MNLTKCFFNDGDQSYCDMHQLAQNMHIRDIIISSCSGRFGGNSPAGYGLILYTYRYFTSIR